MSIKRRNTSSPESSPPPPRKRVSEVVDDDDDADSVEDPQGSDEKPRVSNLFGQTSAFPGLGSEDNDELFYGPANDGIAYLRMVRSEARNVPNLLLAPRGADGIDDAANGEDDAGGYWEDETYIAAPQTGSSDHISRICAAQLRYYESLLAQFRLLQATLRCTPPIDAVQALPKTRPISLPADSEKAAGLWEQHVTNDTPSMVQMASMDADSVWELVKLLGERLHMVEQSPRRLGAWIWAALGKCPERGMCVSEEVGELRALARRAVELLDEEDLRRGQAEVDGPPGSIHDSASSGKAWATSGMVLDMVITIVGEVYGQRDLLEQRRTWQRLGM